MNHSDIDALMEGMAPIICGLVLTTTRPLIARIDELEREITAAREVDHTAAVRVAVADALAALPVPTNGKDADMDAVRAMVTEAVAALPPPPAGQDGRSVTIEDVTPVLDDMVARAVAAIPVPKDGAPGADGRDGTSVTLADVEPLLRELVAALPVPADGRDGKDGVDGQPGRDGAPGAPGKDGVDGAPGRDVDMEIVRGMVADMVAAIPAPKDGVDGRDGKDGENGRDGVDGAPGKDGVDGRSVTVEDVEPLIVARVAELVAAIPVPTNGKDGERGPEGAPGKLPVARAWTDDVTYEGDVRTHNGATWQALKDTAKEPPHADWACLAAAGSDGRSFTVRGTYVEGAAYSELDVVTLNGGAFAARRDFPGECPGDGWQLIASQGKQGKPGLPGKQGERGVAVTASVREAAVDDQGLLTLVNADGTKVEVDLYPVLSKIGG